VSDLTKNSAVARDHPVGRSFAQEIAVDREFAVSIAIALFLAIAVKILTPTATAAGVDLAKNQTENALSGQPDMSWLVSP
jgi:hypothetical protein